MPLFTHSALEARREQLCLQFAIKAHKNPKLNSWFEPNQSTATRSGQNMAVLEEVICRKTRYKKSPIPSFTQILNLHLTKLENNKQTEWSRIHDHIESYRQII